MFGDLNEDGWPEDVVEQMRSDRKDGITRIYGLRLSDAARYLGMSRTGIDKLISVDKLRISTIRPQYRGEKPKELTPAKDIVALK